METQFEICFELLSVVRLKSCQGNYYLVIVVWWFFAAIGEVAALIKTKQCFLIF